MATFLLRRKQRLFTETGFHRSIDRRLDRQRLDSTRLVLNAGQLFFRSEKQQTINNGSKKTYIPYICTNIIGNVMRRWSIKAKKSNSHDSLLLRFIQLSIWYRYFFISSSRRKTQLTPTANSIKCILQHTMPCETSIESQIRWPFSLKHSWHKNSSKKSSGVWQNETLVCFVWILTHFAYRYFRYHFDRTCTLHFHCWKM